MTVLRTDHFLYSIHVLAEYSIKKNKPNDLLVSWLKIVLASIFLIKIEADLKEALILGMGTNSNRGAYQNLKSHGGGGLLNWAGVLTQSGTLNRGNTVYIFENVKHLSAKDHNFAEISVCKGAMVWKSLTHIHILDYTGMPPPRVFGNILRAGILKVNSSFNTSSQSKPGDESDVTKSMPDIFRVRFFSWEIGHFIQGALLDNVASLKEQFWTMLHI